MIHVVNAHITLKPLNTNWKIKHRVCGMWLEKGAEQENRSEVSHKKATPLQPSSLGNRHFHMVWKKSKACLKTEKDPSVLLGFAYSV